VELRLATRGSELALWQAEHVASLLRQSAGIDVDLVLVETSGDRDRSSPLWDIGGTGVFTREVQFAVLDGRADAAVHSAKDLPASWATPGLVLASVPPRGDPRDALVGSTVAGLAPGAVVATGSVRRRAQLAHLRPDLTFTGLRGNVPTRVQAAAGVGAVPVAHVALVRLGLTDAVAEVLDPVDLLPQVGQGALAVECRADDDRARAALAAIEDDASRRAVDAERAFLAGLGAGCDAPVAALARLDGDELTMEAMVASLDGRIMLRESARGRTADVGAGLAARLIELGAPLIAGLVGDR
jgi:hydroxymethylbilane synthase